MDGWVDDDGGGSIDVLRRRSRAQSIILPRFFSFFRCVAYRQARRSGATNGRRSGAGPADSVDGHDRLDPRANNSPRQIFLVSSLDGAACLNV